MRRWGWDGGLGIEVSRVGPVNSGLGSESGRQQGEQAMLTSHHPSSGARCEANTFDGERCLYGALSDTIRRELRDYKQITSTRMQRDYYDDFLQR